MSDIQQIVNNATSAMAGQGSRMTGRPQVSKPDARMQAIKRRLGSSGKKPNG